MQPGQTYAHYSIIAKIGAGGMGEVFRAHDTKLRRDVALKVLPAEFAADPARMARFEQEARALAALNHTNISGIFGIEQHEDLRFMAMELIHGSDLSELIAKKALPTRKALEFALQIAEALEAAHQQGIIHRDLKPQNLMVTPEGMIKVLDFGLARLSSRRPLGDENTASPTITAELTLPGTIMGTPTYMSPEQVQGEDVDARSDIWSFGAVLFEILTGKKAFGGKTVPETMYLVTQTDPDLDLLPASLPAEVRRLVRRCLVKETRNRLQSIGDARIVLQEIQDGSTDGEATTVAPPAPGRRLPWLAAILAAVVLTAAGTWFLKGTPPAVPVKSTAGILHLTLPLPAEYPLNFVGGTPLGAEFTALDLSEDGFRLVYLSRTDQFRGIVAVDLATGDHRPLAGTDNAFLPTLSPDAKWIAFMADSQLKRVPFSGGGVEILASAFGPEDLLWSRDGFLYWVSKQGQVLNRMEPALGSAVETVMDPCDCRMVDEWTGPDKIILHNNGRFVRLQPDGSEEPLDIRGGHAHFFDNRYVISTQSGRLVATRLDGVGTGPLPAPRTVLTGLRTTPLNGRAHYATSGNGLLAYVAGPPADVAQLVRRYPDGRVQTLPFDARIYGAMDVLPGGSRIVIHIEDATSDNSLEVLNLETGTHQVIGDRTRSSTPIWSADGTGVCFTTLVDSIYAIVEYPIDSIEAPTVLLSSPIPRYPYDWSDDGRLLALGEGEGRSSTLLVWDRQTETFTPLVAQASGHLWGAAFSPDGRFVAYTQVGDAGSEVYVVPYPATGKRWLVSAGTGEEPLWRQDRNELVFRRGQGWYKVAYDDTGDFRPSAPELMFEGRYINILGMEYRLLADGSMILLVSANTEETTDHLDFVVNWDQELAEILGAGGD